jgi:transposase-like protein
MKPGCPNLQCNLHQKKDQVIRNGSYFRANDSRTIPRFKCLDCGKKFSLSTFSLAYRQKKRRVNQQVLKLLSSSVSMRRTAIILNIHELTVKRKLIYLAKKARLSQELLLEQLKQNPIAHLQFDDLITKEHTKLKPLSITIAVDAKKRTILGAKVSQIPAFGLLSERAKKKYGFRKSYLQKNLHELFDKIAPSISQKSLIETDEHKLYPQVVSRFFPRAEHKTFKSERGCIAGQGELKKVHFDPLFIINHTCATLRANINRLVRRTWCTTKDPQMLQNHLDLFVNYYNQNLI